MTFRAHFNGTVIVPDEPVNFPVDAPLRVEATPANGETESPSSPASDTIARRLAALERVLARASKRCGPPIPDELLRREHIYDDER